MNETTQIIMKQLNSKIIQGPIGPTGPQGPKGDKGDGTGGSGIVFEALANGETVTIDSSTPPVIPTVPTAPTGLTANPQSAQVSLTWNAVSGATSYKIYRGGILIASPTSVSYVDTGLTNGTSYSYTVSATNAAGESAQSTAATSTPVAPSLPSVPTGLAATAGDTQVALTWNTVSGATSYKVYRGGSLIASPTTANYTDTGRTNGTAYSYTVSAVNGAGESTQSSAATATPIAATTTAIVSDTFTAANGTSINGRVTEVGSKTWSIGGTGAAYEIQNNMFVLAAGNTAFEGFAFVDSALSDCSPEIKFVQGVTGGSTGNKAVRLVFRYQDPTNCWFVQQNGAGTAYDLWKYESAVAPGYSLEKSSTGVTPTDGDVIRVVLSGSSIVVKVNGVSVITHTSALFNTKTKHGIGLVQSATAAKLDNFNIY